MANLLNHLKKIPDFFKQFPYLVAFPSGFSFIGVEKIIEIHFSCPCAVDVNSKLAWSIFTGPPLLIFALLFFFLRPFKHTWFCCSAGANDNKQNCFKALIYCLIPPVMWVIVLYLDGDYFACYKTDWNGVYVFDEQLNRSWCKPIEGMRNENELRDLTQKYFHDSQSRGYIMMAVSSIVIFVLVGIYDCCISGKCDYPKQLLSCCGKRDRTVSIELHTEEGSNVVPLV